VATGEIRSKEVAIDDFQREEVPSPTMVREQGPMTTSLDLATMHLDLATAGPDPAAGRLALALATNNSDCPWMGSAGPWMGSTGLSMVFYFFYLINRGRHLNRLGKGLIYGDL
jgi:hypothetical protein